ncbi:MAG: pseudouridine synthase, partial [Pirellulaceae bacterium]
IDFGIKKFSDFPQAFNTYTNDLTGKTLVSFCTGGIRCEKAAIYMRSIGLTHTFQLEGGILNYFEKTDARHYHGNCFVFDDRELLDPKLAVSPHAK